MKKIFILFCLILIGSKSFAFNIVYPKKNDVIINSNSTFFIGSSDKPLKINGQAVQIHPSGGFAHVVNLVEGKNTFTLESEGERQIFVITRPVIKTTCNLPTQLIQYKDKKYYYVTTDNAPLRSTPIDAGINRITHLQRNVLLTVDGEKSGFYRVILNNEKFGWIAKSNVKAFQNCEITPAKLSGYDYIDSNDYFTFIFHLDKKVPFEIIEAEPFLIKFYNVENNPDNTYTMDFPVSEAFNGKNLIGYYGYYQDNDFILKIRKPPRIHPKKPLKGLRITIDAGHGGSEFGAIGCLGHKEKDINLSISKNLETELKKRGAKVVMTRGSDTYTCLKDRVEIANMQDSIILLSIHANALPDGCDPNKNSGTSIYYYYNQAKPLADTLITTITKNLAINNDSVKQASLALTRNTQALSLLIETAYLINPEDNSKLLDAEFQKDYAKAIADGLEGFFKMNY